ncbi:hypothetical protein [Aureliella helgolandensis]|uniref:DUF4412 domain-containing protein n=1 Tax=Aureliella helgolandensis TaxID=2527968 RepID=A0A518G0N7_9BACT|nr:hypothetical protein [Aureliella helgolandensis]QDV22163.1 hypothetical protein Q31a_04460 [Aureliella helgolandensis]
MLGRVTLMVATILSTALLVESTSAQSATANHRGFRVETDVFVAETVEPFQQTVTLFYDGVAYDIPRDQGIITVVDPKRNRMVLLDELKKQRTEVDLAVLAQLMESAKTSAAATDLAPIIADAGRIRTEEERIIVGEAILQYETTLQTPPATEMADEYAACADALKLFNAWRNPRDLPFARLSLNKAVAERHALPKEITLTQKPSTKIRCLLHATWRLSRDDDARISEIGTMLVSYDLVSQHDFFALSPRVAAATAVQK